MHIKKKLYARLSTLVRAEEEEEKKEEFRVY